MELYKKEKILRYCINHPEVPEKARMLCRPCYARAQYLKELDKYPHKKEKSSGKAICHPDKNVKGHGLCNACYLRYRHALDVDELPKNRTKPICHPNRMHEANGLCRICYMAKFHSDEENKQTAKYTTRKYNLKTMYKMSLEDYDALLKQQNGVCAICFGANHKPEDVLAVDHDHNIVDDIKVRGLLCTRCNTAIGMLKDNPDLLLSAMRYLVK